MVKLPSGTVVSNTLYLQLQGWEHLLRTLPEDDSLTLKVINSEEPEDTLETIFNTFAKGETHAKHQAQVLRYHTWAKSATREPSKEQTLYKYMRHCLRENMAATHAG